MFWINNSFLKVLFCLTDLLRVIKKYKHLNTFKQLTVNTPEPQPLPLLRSQYCNDYVVRTAVEKIVSKRSPELP